MGNSRGGGRDSVDLQLRCCAKLVLDPVVSTPEELSDLMKRETAKYAEVIRKGNIKLE